jgi:hypothetical protein
MSDCRPRPWPVSALRRAELRTVRSGGFADVRLQLANAYFEGPGIELAQLYLSEFHCRRESEVITPFPVAMRAQYKRPTEDFLQRVSKVDRRIMLKSDYYNRFLRAADMIQGVMLKVTEHDRPLGALVLFRTAREPEFTSTELTTVDALNGFIAHGLRRGPGEREESCVDTDDRAVVLADREGKLVHLSADAQRLLLMALVPQ